MKRTNNQDGDRSEVIQHEKQECIISVTLFTQLKQQSVALSPWPLCSLREGSGSSLQDSTNMSQRGEALSTQPHLEVQEIQPTS